MCGIAGLWRASGLKQEDPGGLDRMIAVQRHRGPDGSGRHVDAKRGLALGHARLTIIDLHTGAQPLEDPEDDLALVVNGEFYDYKRIRSTLMTQGARFRTKTDSEIALHLYRRHGLDFIEHLRGEFALALYDGARDRLILARDRFGIRPLFFHHDGESLLFGSEAKVILAHGQVRPRLSRRDMLNQLMHTMVPGSSAFAGIRALEPGHILMVERRDGRLSVRDRRYWDLDFPAAGEHRQEPAEEQIRLVRDRLVEAVVLRLEADVPVGCYLSGGIDSCSILGMASGAMQAPVKAFTISFDHDEYDEAAIAREMAQSVEADQDMIRLGADELYGENYLRTVWHAERTFYNTLGVAKYCMSRHVNRAGYKTVITGEGADELFAGYPAFKRDMFLHGMADVDPGERHGLEQALQEANRLFRGAILSEHALSHPALDELCGFTPSWIQPWLTTLDLGRPLLADGVLEELDGYDPVAAIVARLDPEKVRGRHPLDQSQYTWSKTMLEGQILNWGGDRVDMANSMESRPAFLDHHLAEAAVGIPPGLRIKGVTEKWILREAVRGVLPEVLYRRQKFAFMAPPAHTDESKRKGVERLMARHLGPQAIAEAGLFDGARVAAFLDAYGRDRDPVSLTRKDALLNHMLCLQILHRQFVQGEAPVTVAGSVS